MDAVGSAAIPQSTPILNEDGDPIWKVLVFDNKGRDVISSVLRVNDLRAWGVTIHLYAAALYPCRLVLWFMFKLTRGKEHKFRTLSNTRCSSRLPRRADRKEYTAHYF